MDEEFDQGQDGTVESGAAPYAEYLENVPEDYRDEVESAFKEWDANVTRRFQAIGEEIAPYKELIENYDPRVLTAGINLLSQIADDPQKIYDQLAETYNLGSGTPEKSEQGAEMTEEEASSGWQERYEQQQQMLEELQNQIHSQQSRQNDEQQMQQFENYLDELRESKGDFDDDYVLSKVAAGYTPEQAIDSFHELLNDMSSQEPEVEQPPVVLGSSSGVESADIDFTQISDSETKDIVTQLLKQANQ